MTIAEIQAQWEKDGPVDKSRLDDELSTIPKLHHRYWVIYSEERRDYARCVRALQVLKRQRFDWYLGRMSDDEMAQLKWPPQPLKILRGDVDTYLNGDALLQQLQARIDEHDAKLKFLESVISAINFRSNQIRTMVDYMKFSRGEL